MQKNRSLIIDIGTNSVLALIVDIDGGELSVVSDKKITTRLGEGLFDSGRLSGEAMDRTAQAVSTLVRDCDYDSVLITGTEALRRAENSDDFINLLKTKHGLELTIISGETEAQLSFHGAFYNLSVDKSNVLLVDVGGGSTELILANNNEITQYNSVQIGAMILKELSEKDELEYYKARAETILMEKLKEFEHNVSGTFVGSGGTITSAGAIYKNLEKYEASKTDGMTLTVNDLNEIGKRFESVPIRDRKSLIPFDPERADLILPGLGIFLAVMTVFNMNEVIISNGGLRFGAAIRPDLVISR